MLSHRQLIELINYDESTGIFTWNVDRTGGVKKGDEAGYINNLGYRMIKLFGELHLAHRLAWFYKHKYWPSNLDHLDRNKDNNSLNNLRECSKSENQMNRAVPSNNTSGVKGVVWNKRTSKWQAQAGLNGKRYYLGLFNELSDAKNAYISFCKENHGEFYAGD
ncbi:HNH endonuclease [Dickeya poaceiphila]|uniref:HNH endonuclease n=1 Tax=Dickeya poaceiphila TaxID=568768 RepID=A0A5B8I4L3_9GAMM|nr:HNH endonuclease [Dickeya poaceiphila]QDX29533.1 HNH endonuclease [Dickeya poaceiphila]